MEPCKLRRPWIGTAVLLTAGAVLGATASTSVGREPSARRQDVGAAWRLSPEPVLTVGDASGGPATFGRVAGVHVDRAGRVIVVDSVAGNIRVFGPRGQYLSTWGRKGRRRGEYTSPALLGVIHGDSLAILDRMTLTVLSGDGQYGRSLFPVPMQILGVRRDARLVMFEITIGYGMPSDGDVLGPDTAMLDLLDAAGQVEALGAAATSRSVYTGGEYVRLPFSPPLTVATSGDTVFTLADGGNAVQVYGADGLRARWPAYRRPEPVTDDDRAAYRRNVEQRGLPTPLARAFLAAANSPHVPKFKPVYDGLVATDDGEVWARRFGWADEPREWDVYTSAGVLRGTVRTPAGFTLKQVTADRVVGVLRDTVGIERVVVFQKRGATSDSHPGGRR